MKRTDSHLAVPLSTESSCPICADLAATLRANFKNRSEPYSKRYFVAAQEVLCAFPGSVFYHKLTSACPGAGERREVA